MTRLIDADALINDLEYDVELDARALDDTDLVGLHRELTQFDKDCKANTIAFLKEAPTIDAIPIKWLTAQAENPSNSDRLRNAIDYIVYTLWAERSENENR